MALLFTILCGLAAVSLAYFINYFAKGHFAHSTEAVLDAKLNYLKLVGPENITSTESLYFYLDPETSITNKISSNLSHLAEGILVFNDPESGRRIAAKIYSLADSQKLLVGTDITDISNDFMFMQWLGIASICFVMVVVFVSYLISVFVVSGTNKIAETAREIINTGDLSRRVDVRSRWDDLSNMAVVLNMLLERVEELMVGVRQVSDSIAHDLRTPLTRIRNKLENLENNNLKNELLDETDQLLNTFNALLRISRIEAEKQRSRFANINLAKLLDDVVEFYEPLAEQKSILLSLDLGDVSVFGDRDLLFQAYANLLDNALKFTPQNGRVNVTLYRNEKSKYVEVSNTGASIPEDERDKIFDRFYRGEKSRTSSGTGLGLSLVGAVIRLHEGEIRVENIPSGVKFVTIL